MIVDIPSRLVLFDGVCNLCNGSVQFIIGHDPNGLFSFTSLQSAAGQQVLKTFNFSTVDFDSFIYIKEGKAYHRSTAALMVMKDLSGLWKILYLFIIIPRPLRDWCYDLIARYRYTWFGKRDSCMIPSPDLKRRFLD